MDKLVIKTRPVSRHIFRMYDIRGLAGDEINPELAYRLGRAFATFIRQSSGDDFTIAAGRDNRVSSPRLHAAICEGIGYRRSRGEHRPIAIARPELRRPCTGILTAASTLPPFTTLRPERF